MSIDVRHGDSREVLKTLADASIDAVVTDPPYSLVSIQKRFGKPGSAATRGGDVYSRASRGFMGKQWDTGETAFDAAFWAEVLRVLKPGGHVAAFGGTRTYHRLACAVEDAGFEIRDMIGWLYGSGFPKSHAVAKGIDRALGVAGDRSAVGDAVRRIRPGADQEKDGSWEKLSDRTYQPHNYVPGSDAAAEWQGWGTALKPAQEPIVLARKPLDGTVAGNVLAHGTGALNIDGCRVPSEGGAPRQNEPSQNRRYTTSGATNFAATPGPRGGAPEGRWPANIIHDGSDEVLGVFPEAPGQLAAVRPDSGVGQKTNNILGKFKTNSDCAPRGDSGSAARFFYSAKATKKDRAGSKHPTVKPVALMRYLCRLVTPPGGVILDPFAGSGTTLQAAADEGFSAIGIEREAEYYLDIKSRMGVPLAPEDVL